ncbi:hypothetical protein DYY67_0175 [Candidatus Nitrosotalea sp. TS]|nr:hypothetical protein [Candidatus Nitrosotalea sp. TS]
MEESGDDGSINSRNGSPIFKKQTFTFLLPTGVGKLML